MRKQNPSIRTILAVALRFPRLHLRLASSLSSLDLSVLRKPNQEFAAAVKSSPQLSVKGLPLLASCLPSKPLCQEDLQWMDSILSTVKELLHSPLRMVPNDLPDVDDQSRDIANSDPLAYYDTLMYLALQHVETPSNKTAKYIRAGHSRLWFLGQYVMELALVEYFLLRYPREVTACIRERIYGLTSRKVLPHWMCKLGLDNIIFQGIDVKELKLDDRLNIFRAVFWALLGVSYLCKGMQEVYRLLFEVFGLDPDAELCSPKPRCYYNDEDNIFPELEKRKISWEELSTFKTPDDAIFAKSLLFKACVPPGMRRFRGNIWEISNLPTVLQLLGYPLQHTDGNSSVIVRRNGELELGLQLCFLDPLAYKSEHPRFCNERLEYLGQKIQDVVMAERLITKHLDAPGVWLQERHRKLLFNRVCGRYLRELKLHEHIIYTGENQEPIYRSKNSQKIASISVSQALHGLGYAVYGKAEVRRIMFQVFDFERSR